MKILLDILTLGISYFVRQHIKIEKYIAYFEAYTAQSKADKELILKEIKIVDKKIDKLKDILIEKGNK